MKVVLILSALLCSLASYAEDNGVTQHFFQAQGGQHIVTPNVGLTYGKVDYTSGSDLTYTSGQVGLSYEYGVLDNLSAGIIASYSSSTLSLGTTDATASGLMTPSVFMKSFTMVAPNVALRYGADLYLSIEPHKTDSTGSSSNRSSGRTEINPYFGVDFRLAEKHLVGGRLTHSFLLGDAVTESSTGQETKTTGGEVTAVFAFYEFTHKKFLVGATLFHAVTSDDKTSGGGSSEYVSRSGYIFNANFFVSDQWTLVPEVRFTTTLDSEANGVQIDSYALLAASFSARYSF